ncbi:MAG: hypothetical protein GY820_04410, partial [Gammaproteobacteria bacterium]|nr:hypothetical protein [Gammaproteobacteria bacterium]
TTVTLSSTGPTKKTDSKTIESTSVTLSSTGPTKKTDSKTIESTSVTLSSTGPTKKTDSKTIESTTVTLSWTNEENGFETTEPAKKRKRVDCNRSFDNRIGRRPTESTTVANEENGFVKIEKNTDPISVQSNVARTDFAQSETIQLFRSRPIAEPRTGRSRAKDRTDSSQATATIRKPPSQVRQESARLH